MKKLNLILASLTLLLAPLAPAQQTNLMPIVLTGITTNTTISSAYITIAGAAITNQPYTASNPMYLTIGDPLPVAFAKVNSNEVFLARQIAANTNTTTVLNFSNSVLSSRYYSLLTSNYFVFTGSNYLGSFPQLQSWSFNYPQIYSGSTDPGHPATENLFGSTNAGAAWFQITNNTPNITVPILLAAVGDSNSSPGAVFLQAIDHPELLGRTNYSDGQFNQVPDAVNPLDAVNLETFNLLLGNALNGQFAASRSNNVTYATLSQSGSPIITIASPSVTLLNNLSKVGTNLLLKIAQTNLVTGWQITSSTNLAALYSWPVYTNWAGLATNSGIVTFTIPILPGVAQYFYWPKGPVNNSITITPPLTLLGGLLYPSNTWSLYAVTNAMVNGQFWVGTSNGFTLISLLLSNGVPVIKQLAP